MNRGITQGNIGRLFAVIHTQDGQRKVTAEDIIVLRRHTDADVGEKIVFNKVTMRYTFETFMFSEFYHHSEV